MSKHKGLFQPGYDWPESRSGNLPEILASDERKKGCVLPPLVERNPKCQRRIEPTQPTVENTDNAVIKRSGSVSFSQNDQSENLNGYKSRRCLNNRSNATVFDGKVPRRREAIVEGLVRRDAASFAEQHPRASLDTKKSRNEKTCSTSENVIIEEIYLLSLNKRAIPMEQKSRHSSLRETRSDEPNNGEGVSRYGEILSRRVYYDGSLTDSSFPEELATEMNLARKPRRQSEISSHRSLRKTRSDESNESSENRPCGTIGSHPLARASYASLHRKEANDKVVNMTGEGKAESEEEKGEQMSKERANEGHNEAAGAAESEQEQEKEQRWILQVASEAKEEAKGREEEMLACVATAELVQRQKQQRRCRRVSKTNTETRDREEESAGSVEKREQRRRRNGVCETVDKTAARRRRVKVLRKKLFGDDLPVDYELMTEQETAIGRVLNKRL